MWRYLILNIFWLAILFLVHFFGSRRDRNFILIFIFSVACALAFKSTADPFVWAFYLSFSLAAFYGAGRFRDWATAPSAMLSEEIESLSRTAGSEKAALEAQASRNAALSGEAEDLIEFYDHVKEMSKSLDHFETFLIFAETLSGHFKFDTLKLVLFDDQEDEGSAPAEAHEIRQSDLLEGFDRGAYLKNRKRAKTDIFPFDQKVLRALEKERGPIQTEELKKGFYEEAAPRPIPFMAYPVFLDERMCAALIVVGIEEKDLPLLRFLIERFVSEIQRVKLYERIETLATTDGLTGIYVRRHLTERLEGEVDRCKRFTLKLSYLMIDVDFFKHFNDDYGHLVGDVVLKEVAQTIKKNIREVDLVGRYGGEEFGVLLVETGEAEAALVAERIRRSIEENRFKAYDEELKITVSIGCSTFSSALNDPALLVDSADAALYEAKRLGRNRVCLALPPAS